MKATTNKTTRLVSRSGWLVVAAAFALMVAPAAQAKKAGPKAAFVKGTVETAGSQDGPFKKLKRNKRVKAGAFVRTGESSRVELKFDDGSVLRLGPSSLLHVKKSGFDKKTKKVDVSATLVGGKAWAKVSKLVGADAKFEVKSQNAVAGVRGTIFRVNIDNDQATVVKVYDGAVAVSNSPYFAEKPNKNSVVAPIDPNRQQMAAPFQEVSKKEFEQVVKRMMEVRIGADGQMKNASAFTSSGDKLEDPEWVNWNLACDGGDCDKY